MICVKCKKEISDNSLFCNYCGKKQVVTHTKVKVRRRARGTGTIRVDKRKAKPYIVFAPRTTNVSSQIYLGSFKTVKEAQLFLESYKAEKFPELYNATLSKIYELWSKVHFQTLETQSGIDGYTSAYRDLGLLHNRKMRELKTSDFQMCIDVVAEKYSRSKCEKVKQLCSQLCKYAMQNDLVDKNYAEFLVLPKEEKSEKTTFKPSELKLLWQHTDDERVRLILFMTYTGFRIGEVATILKTNVHLDEGYIIGGIKTEAGKNRLVPLPPNILEIKTFVSDWLNNKDNDSNLLINVTANSLRQYWFYPVLAELGMIELPIYNPKSRKKEYKNPRLTPHSARHTFASLSSKAGILPENLQKIIGHADFSTTANIYVHQDIEVLSSEMAKIRKY